MMILGDMVRKLLNVPFKHRGRDYEGLDCLGAILVFYRDFLNINIPDPCIDYKPGWAAAGQGNYFLENYHTYFVKAEKPTPFDLVFFKNKKGIVDHVGIVLFNNKFFHFTEAGGSVSRYSEAEYKDRIQGFYRYKNGVEKKG